MNFVGTLFYVKVMFFLVQREYVGTEVPRTHERVVPRELGLAVARATAITAIRYDTR